ncbi:MAG: glutathione peroxidase [Alphaproteobacteria bacterium PA2]|nr:MAG: glutathione peroxidase [Alphaproteobacteria bacterium PA2]
MTGIYDFSVRAPDGSETPLRDFEGKVILIVNTASKCGFTPQYEGLEALYREHNDAGLAILGFPCNQFGAQEPGDAKEIANFCSLTYDVTFPLMAKIDVNGPKADPLFAYLKKQKGGLLGDAIKWNFTKFLIGRTGKVLGRYAPTVTPAALEGDIKRALAA